MWALGSSTLIQMDDVVEELTQLWIMKDLNAQPKSRSCRKFDKPKKPLTLEMIVGGSQKKGK